MTTTQVSEWPGSELKQFEREVCQRLVREQGWRYARNGGHPQLYAPSGGRTFVATTPGEGRARANFLATLKRLGARLDTERPAARRRSVTPPDESAGVGAPTIDKPWTDSEWRDLQAASPEWWRAKLFGSAESVSDETLAAAPSEVRQSQWFHEFMDRLEQASQPRRDARGESWTLSQARQLIRDGYSLAHTTRITGWGAMWLEDLVTEQGG